jgi:UPF0755 protein
MLRKFILLVLAAGLLLAAFIAYPYATFYLRPVAPPSPVTVVIPTGASFARTAASLQDAGVVSSASKLRLLARLRDDARLVKAGEYAFAEAATPDQILDRLIAGDVVFHRVTIPEGYNLNEIGAALLAARFDGADAFNRLARDPDFLASLQIDAPSLEGYLFPETYTFISGMSAERLVRSMVGQLRGRLTPDIIAAASERGLDIHQLLTLASIVQKEAGNREEMPKVAAVFHNRLRLRMPLQADPTVIYGVEDYKGTITRRHLQADTPYNTYRIPALPPGPIASPGEDALRATAFPADVDYLYFVSAGDGTHVFSRTLQEHNRAVQRYRLLMKKSGR